MISEVGKKDFYGKLSDYTLDGSKIYINEYSKAKEHHSKVQMRGPIRHRSCDQGPFPMNAFLFIISF